MIEIALFRGLPLREQALLAVAVLLDGREAANYFDADSGRDPDLRRVALQLASLSPELRMPLLGSALRSVLAELRTRRS